MSTPPAYWLRNVRKAHDTGFVLDVPQLEIQSGDVLALLGPTGAGKSTLLRLLAGLDRPDSGSIELNATPFEASRLPLATRRRITMVSQRPLLLTGSVRMNVAYGLRLRKAENVEQRVESILQRLALDRIAAQSAATLSGGQTQLVALARALVLEPEVLLLDEPTAHFDPAHVALAEEVLREFCQRTRSTVVWATHNLFQAQRVSQRSMLLLDGKLVEIAPTEQVFDSPRDPRTADFVQGRMVY